MKNEYVNRFTSIPVLLDMIKRKRLVLMDPELWEDKNDSELMLEYKKRRKVENLYALCFSRDGETIHHWNAYAGTVLGCCIEFDYALLTATFDKINGVRYDDVEYKKINDLNSNSIITRNIPFTKRQPYECEKEFRVIWEGRTRQWCYEVKIDLRMLGKITMGPRMPDNVFRTLSKQVKSLLARPDLSIKHSTIYENARWINKFKS